MLLGIAVSAQGRTVEGSGRRVRRRSTRGRPGWLGVALLFAFLALAPAAFFVQRQLQREIEAGARRALANAGAVWARVGLVGERLRVTGVAPTPELRQQAVHALGLARCRTFAGEVSCGAEVEDAQTLAPPPPPPSPYPAELVRGASGVRLTARVPSASAAAWLAGAARAELGEVKLTSEVVEGRPFSSLEPAYAQLFGVAVALKIARIEFDGLAVKVRGMALDESARARAKQAFDALPAPYVGREFDVVREDELLECERRVKEVVDKRPIKFVLFGAELKHSSKAGLKKLAEVLTPCPGRVIIEGHSDNVGEPENNVRLSRERAEVVLGKLAEEGLPRERLTAVGLGEAQPIADNHTRAGRALNRRIEFRLERPDLGVQE
jgi:outer membrane protein OmpA-like peptidoglycan-associated protein